MLSCIYSALFIISNHDADYEIFNCLFGELYLDGGPNLKIASFGCWSQALFGGILPVGLTFSLAFHLEVSKAWF